MTDPVTVTLAEDDAVFRAGLETFLDLVDDVEVIDLCADLDQLMASIKGRQPSVVITDIRMPPTGTTEGVEAARMIAEQHPEVGVIVLSQFVDPALAMSVLGDGTRKRGYILKEHVADASHLATAIRAVAGNGSFIDPDVLDALVEARKKGPDSGVEKLTARELEVLEKIAEGHNNKAVGEELFIGERSVEKHISSIFGKLELSTDDDTNRRVMAVLLYLAHVGRTTMGE